MTRETAKKKIRGFPLRLRSVALEDIDNRAYETVELVPVLEIESGYYQMTVNYKIRLEDGYIFGKAQSLDDFVRMHEAAGRGEVFTVMYLKNARIILEIEERDD